MPEGKRVAPTRDRILDEAFGLFADRGFHAVSVRDIAAAAGIKDASLYNHFPGKQALFDAIIARELDRLRAMFQPKGVLFDVGDDPREYDPSDPRALERQVHESVRPFFEDASLRQLRRLLVISQFESEDAAQAYRLVFIERPLALQRSAFEHGMATGDPAARRRRTDGTGVSRPGVSHAACWHDLGRSETEGERAPGVVPAALRRGGEGSCGRRCAFGFFGSS